MSFTEESHKDGNEPDRLLDRLRTDICALVFPPGFKLNTQMLEAHYQVGLNPLREALSVLTGEGLVKREDRRGFRVSPVSLAEFNELTEARAAIELEMLARAFTHQHPDWMPLLDRAVDLLGPNVKAGDQRPLDREWECNHRRFHLALIDGHRSPLLLELWQRIYDRYDRYRMLALPSRAYLANVGQDHLEMANAVRQNEHDQARTFLRRHIFETSETIRVTVSNLNLTNSE